MSERDRIETPTAEFYFNKYGKDGIGKGADRWMVKRQLIDAFRKEIFDLVALRTKVNYDDAVKEGNPETRRVVKNIIHDTTMKWKKVCKLFSMYKETANLLEIKDLKLYDEIDDVGMTSEEANEILNGSDTDGDEVKIDGDKAYKEAMSLVKKLHDEGKSIKEIAEALDISEEILTQHMIEAGIIATSGYIAVEEENNDGV